MIENNTHVARPTVAIIIIINYTFKMFVIASSHKKIVCLV